MSGIAQGLVTHRMACSEQPQPALPRGRPSSAGRWKPDHVAVWLGGVGRGGRKPPAGQH